ncbi:MAG: hypothetical protein KDJ38_01295 [Gammaproteobacteria bacterium]|nr:hypothetical protein [Gammaproteobacteria bacterium]
MNTQTTTQAASANFTVSAERDFSWLDSGLVLAVIAVAFYYLYLKIWRKRGACSSCGNKKGCGVSQANAGASSGVHIPVDKIQGRQK